MGRHALKIALAAWAVLLLWSARIPEKYYFDEVHYVPAGKVLLSSGENINPEHPLLGKILIGLSARALGPVVGEPLAFRIPSVFFGLICLAALFHALLELGFPRERAALSVVLTSLNFLWFVQSKIATLDMISAALALAAFACALRRNAPAAAAFFALACNAKWSALGYFPLMLAGFLHHSKHWRVSLGKAAALIVSAVFLRCLVDWLFFRSWLGWVQTEFGLQILDMRSINFSHPYQSAPWSWPLLLRPLWYWSKDQGAESMQGIWAGGNPLLWGVGLLAAAKLPFSIFFSKKKFPLLILSLGYSSSVLFWSLAPRDHLRFFYYFLPSSLWLGPLCAWFLAGLFRERWRAALVVFLAINFGLFLYFFPILSGIALPRIWFDARLWLQSWV